MLFGWLLALLSGLLLALSFPLRSSESDPLSGLSWLAWIALVPLGLAIAQRRPNDALRLGWLAGTIAYLIILYWVVPTMQTYGHLPLAPSLALLVLLAGYVGLYIGLFAAGWRWFHPRWPRWSWLIVPALWVALEWLRGHLLSGFPWALLGYSQYRQLPLIQIADITSVYGVSFLLVLVNVALTETAAGWTGRPRSPLLTMNALPRYAPLLAAVALVAGAVGYGTWRIAAVEASLVPGPRVGLVQGNIPQELKWNPSERQMTIERYARLTRQAADDGAQLIIWPEASTPFVFDEEPSYEATIRGLAASTHRYLLFGSPGVDRDRAALLNSAYLLNPDGTTQARYDKLHLVPFGEYVPLGPLLSFINKLVVGIGDFVPGRGPVLMEAAGHPLGVAICFEIIFPELVRQFPQHGARIIATITNDAWFGRSGAPLQHFSMAVFRAVENHTPVVRSANTGISGIISATGAIVRRSDLFVETVLVDTIALSTERPIYTRVGDIFAVGCGILVALLLIIGRKKKPPD